MRRWQRWAVVSRWPGERAETITTHLTRGAAVRVAAVDNKYAYQQGTRGVMRVEPTDRAPLVHRREWVVKVLEDWGSPLTADALASFTAMSPPVVLEVLLMLGRDRRAVFRVVGTGDGVWRLRTPEEWAADQRV